MSETPIDRLFESPHRAQQPFSFDEDVAQVFDNMLSRSVPLYDILQAMITELAYRYVQPNTSVYDLGCSTGTTLFHLAQYITDPSVRWIGIDSSKPMLEKARNKAKQHCPDIAFDWRCHDLNTPLSLSSSSVVFLTLCLQFIHPDHRDSLIKTIYDGLCPGGAMILVEKTCLDDNALDTQFQSLYHDFKKRQGYSQVEIDAKRDALKGVLIPSTSAQTQALLNNNGFDIVEPFFQWYNFSGFIAIKRIADD